MGGGLNQKPGPKTCGAISEISGKTKKLSADGCGGGEGTAATTKSPPDRQPQPLAGLKCCNSEAPTLARWLAGRETSKPFDECIAAKKGLYS